MERLTTQCTGSVHPTTLKRPEGIVMIFDLDPGVPAPTAAVPGREPPGVVRQVGSMG
jgi:hypothetical protein